MSPKISARATRSNTQKSICGSHLHNLDTYSRTQLQVADRSNAIFRTLSRCSLAYP